MGRGHFLYVHPRRVVVQLHRHDQNDQSQGFCGLNYYRGFGRAFGAGTRASAADSHEAHFTTGRDFCGQRQRIQGREGAYVRGQGF